MLSINKVGKKIAQLMGDGNQYGLDDTTNFTHFKQLCEHAPFAHLLPYQAYDEARQLFLNDNSIGFGLELLPLTGASIEEINRLTSMLNEKLPVNADLHIQLIASNKIGEYLDRFKEVRGRAGINTQLAENRYEYYKRITHTSITKHAPAYLRDYRIFIYYSEPIAEIEDLQFTNIENLREAWKTSLESITVVKNLDITSFMGIVSETLNPTDSIYWPKVSYDRLNKISGQVVKINTSYDINDSSINVSYDNSKFVIQNFSVESFPEQAALWQSGENIGKIMDSSLQLSCPFILNLHLRAFDKQASKARAQKQFMLNEKKASSRMAVIMPSIKHKHKDWTYLRDELNGTQRLVKVSYALTLISKEVEYKKDYIRLNDLFSANHWQVACDRFLQLPVFLQNLPFLMTSGLHEDLNYFNRHKTMTMFNAVNLMPLVAEYKGVPASPGLMFVGRRGQISNWSNFDNRDGNYNLAIAAKSRAGKSFLMQDIISNTLCQSGIVRVIDLGRSYEKFCKLVGGQYVELKDGVCINPFTHVVELSKSLSQIKAIIATMAHPSGDVSDKELSFITNAITLAWDKKKNNTTITDVVFELAKSEDNVAADWTILLEKYTKDGQFAAYFQGSSTIDISNPFIVLELEELKNKADLKAVVVLSIMLQITEEFYGLPRDIKKLCVIDEAWDLLHASKVTAGFIEAGYRRVAKQNGAFVTIVQSVNDYFRNETGIAIFENSDNQIIMAQLNSTIDQLKNNKRLNFTPYEEQLLRSFAGTNQYKECLIRTPNGSNVARVVFDPFTRILYSTRGEEFEAVNRLVANGLNMQDAVSEVARKVYADEY